MPGPLARLLRQSYETLPDRVHLAQHNCYEPNTPQVHFSISIPPLLTPFKTFFG